MPPRPDELRWGIVVPVKRLPLAKTRLATFGDLAREELALAFAADVVAAALACERVGVVLAVTDDARAARVLRSLGAQVAADDPDAGLNPALAHGAALARAAGADAVATLSADLPSLRPQDLATALDAVPPGGRAFVADADGSGTTLLAAGTGADLQPEYGPASAARHRASGAVELAGTPGLRRDVDTPDDLREALLLGVGPRTLVAAEGVG